MKNLINSLFFMVNISITLSCNAPVTNDKSVLYDNDIEVVKLINEITDNEKLVQQHIKSDFMNTLLHDYNERIILTSLLAMDEFHFLFPDTANLLTVINYGYQQEYISASNKGVLCKLENFLDIKKYNRIQSWCSLYQVIMFVFEQLKQGGYDDFNDFGEIMDEMDESKCILREKYIEIEGQSYESLSTSQQSMFIMDIITYISSLPPKQQVDFVRRLLNLFVKQ